MHRPLIGLVCLKQNNIADNETDFTANAGCVHRLLYLSQRDVYFFIYPDSETSHLEAQKPTGHMVQGQKLEWLVMTTRFILFLSGCLETAENIGFSWEVYGITVQTKDLKVKYLMLFFILRCVYFHWQVLICDLCPKSFPSFAHTLQHSELLGVSF